MPAKKEETFEQKLERLESMTAKMENGDMPLMDALKTYEEGMKLAKDLTAMLSGAEARLHELKGDAEVPVEEET